MTNSVGSVISQYQTYQPGQLNSSFGNSQQPKVARFDTNDLAEISPVAIQLESGSLEINPDPIPNDPIKP